MNNTLTKITLCLSVLLLGITFELQAQDIKQTLSAIQSKISEIQVDKVTFKQSIEVLDAVKGKLNFISVSTDDKGKSVKENYEFYLSDIDKNTITRKPSGKKLLVSLSTQNKQKFIKFLKDDNLDSYVDNFEMLAPDADAASTIIEDIKKAISQVKASEKTWANTAEAINGLKTNIREVSTKTGKTEQEFSNNAAKEYLVTLYQKSTDTKGAVVEEKYNLNITDLNKNAVKLKVSGTSLSINADTKNGDKLIQYYKNNEIQNYTNSIDILSDELDQARTIISALQVAIEKSKATSAEFSSSQQATDFIKSKTGDVTFDGKTFGQKIEFAASSGNPVKYTFVETDSKGKAVSNVYDFYLAYADPNTVTFKTSGKKLLLTFLNVGKGKLIKYNKDNALQSYQGDIEILYSDVETAREVAEAFKVAIKKSEAAPAKWASITEAANFLNSRVNGDAVGNDKYELSAEADLTEPFMSEYLEKKTDAKGVVTEMKYVYYPFMLDANSIQVESSGKYLVVSANVKGKQQFVKKMKGDQSQGFQNSLEIMAFDAKQAKDIAEVLKYFANNTTPKEKNWGTKEKAMDFVKETVGNFANEGKEVKQKFDIVENDPCKATLTINTIDNKGKTTEEIYEFSLSDMNKLMVEYKIRSKNVYISLTCKNKGKFVKVYKNGAQQAFAPDVEILEDDVDTARELSDALRFAIIQCEK